MIMNYVQHYMCIIILCVLLFWVEMDMMIKHHRKKKLKLCIILIIIALISEVMCLFFDNTLPKYRLFSILANLTGFSITPFIFMLEASFFDEKDNIMKKWAYIPAFINLLLVLASLFGGYIFYVTPENIYTRGPLFNIYVSVFTFSLLYALIKKIMACYRMPSYFFKIIFIASALLNPFFIVQVIFPELKITMLLMTFYIMLNYAFSLQMNSLIDDLSGLLNRNALEKTIERIKNKHKYNYVVIMFDIDNFKYINDTYGHIHGDESIVLVSKLLKSVFKTNLFRYGGDEFVVLLKTDSLQHIQPYIDQLNTKQKENHNLPSLSYGYALYQKGDDIHHIITLADEDMYKNKNNKEKPL